VPVLVLTTLAGGFVRCVVYAWRYDGVKRGTQEPAVIAIFGEGPVNVKLTSPQKHSWRWV
jgi:hypothetical protein